ncbi:MAG: hypothetical protein GY928_32500, partial [Colwellia sp.]|nr:hypothetical protein [Colwellia sp.]
MIEVVVAIDVYATCYHILDGYNSGDNHYTIEEVVNSGDNHYTIEEVVNSDGVEDNHMAHTDDDHGKNNNRAVVVVA